MTREEAKGNLIHAIRWNDMPKKEALDMAIKALETLEEFEKAQIITGGRLNGRIYAYKCGLEAGKRKALEQELCSDAISRQAVRDTIFSECSGTKLDIDFAKVLLLQRAIKALPPVTPQEPCDDAINREDTLKAMIEQLGIRNEDYLIPAEATLYKIVKNMPPVTPQPKMGHWGKDGECPFCGYLRQWDDDNFCGHCGAKMIEPQESEE